VYTGSMAYIYLDESGDLGFEQDKKRSTTFFLVTFLFVPMKRPLNKLVSYTHRQLKLKHKMKRPVLHCFQEKPVTRIRLLKKLAEKDCRIMAIVLNKNQVYTKLQNEKAVLYNYITNILIDRIVQKKLLPVQQRIHLIASRRETSKFLNLNFKNYLEQQVQNKHLIDFEVQIKKPHEEKGLQAVDFVSWAIFRKYEYGDDSYYNIVKPLIIEEDSLFQ
jgi:hypothetical protein